MLNIIPAAAHIPADAINTYAVFRGTLDGNITQIRVYANRFYELRIDEKLIAYGPVRSREPRLYYDEFILSKTDAPKLVALKVHARKGTPEAYVDAVTDWKVKTLTSYDSAAPKCIGDVGYSEYCTLDTEQNWFKQDYSDDGFSVPNSGTPIVETEFLPRPIPLFTEKKIVPLSIVRKDNGWLADFGSIVYGRPDISGTFAGRGTVALNYIESLDSGWAHTEGKSAMYSDKLTGEGVFSWKSFWKRPCRYLFISGAIETLDSLCIQEYGYPVVRSGSFRCSDEKLNYLWEIAERTLRVCLDDIINDCPHRDQAQWMDAFVSAKVALSLYGDTKLARKCLIQHGLCSFVNGHLLSPSICGSVLFPDYALVHVIFMKWYWQVTGDTSLLEELFENTAEGFNIFFKREQPDGLLKDIDKIMWSPTIDTSFEQSFGQDKAKKVKESCGNLYLDNTFELCKMGKSAGLNAIYFGALNAMCDICAILGKPADLYREKAEKVRKNFPKVFAHDKVKGCFKDSDSRFEHFYNNINFSCELGKWTGVGAAARVTVTAPEDGERELLAGAYAQWRLKLNGVQIYEDTRNEKWTRPSPMYDPVKLNLSLKKGTNVLEFESACNNINWDLFFDPGLPVDSCEIREIDYKTGTAVDSEWKKITPRPWFPPYLSQSTNAYAAWNGLMENTESLKNLLPSSYPRNYISIRVPMFCTETTDAEALKCWIMPVNTPWTGFYMTSSLFNGGFGKEALDFIRRAWGVMLDNGAVNTWEEWGNHASLCHAWGSSPAYFMIHDVLGVQYEKLGEKTIVIRPDLCGLDFAEGTAALSVDGSQKISVSLRKANGKTEVRISEAPGYRIEKDFSRLENPEEIKL